MKALGGILLLILAFAMYQWIAPKVLSLDSGPVAYDTGSDIGNELCGQYGYDYHAAPNGFYNCERTADDKQRIQSYDQLPYGKGILGGNN